MDTILSAVEGFISNKSELEKKLDEALSKANHGTPLSMLREIAAATNDPSAFPVIMREVWNSLNHAGKNWRQIYKGLVLLEILIKNGHDRVVQDARDCLFRIRTLSDFSYHEGGADRGAGVREKASAIVALLSDSGVLADERAQARRMRDKFVGLSNVGTPMASHTRPSRPLDDRESYGGRSFESSSRRVDEDRSSRIDAAEYGVDSSDFSSAGFSSSGPSAPAGRRGRRPAGRATHADAEDSHTSSAGAAEGGSTDAFGGADAEGFDAFAAPAPAPAAPAISAPRAGATPGKLAVNIKPNTVTARTTPARAPAGQASAAAPASGSDGFDPFGGTTHTDFGSFTAAVAPAPAPAPSVDFFASPAPAPAQSRPAPTFAAPAPAPTTFDPFAGGFSAPAPAAPAPSHFGADPFAPSSAAAIMSQYPGGAPPSAFPSHGNDFGSFNAAPKRDDDVDRLVALDALGAKPGSVYAPSAASKAAVPLGQMAKPAMGAPAASVMGAAVTGAPSNISTMGAAAPFGAPTFGAPAFAPGMASSMGGGFPGAPAVGGGFPGGYGQPAPGYGMPQQMGGGMMPSGGMHAPGFGHPAAPGFGGGFPAPTAPGMGFGPSGAAFPSMGMPAHGMAPRPAAPAPAASSADPFAAFGAF